MGAFRTFQIQANICPLRKEDQGKQETLLFSDYLLLPKGDPTERIFCAWGGQSGGLGEDLRRERRQRKNPEKAGGWGPPLKVAQSVKIA